LLILIVENKNIEDNLSGTSMIIYVYHFMAFSLFAFVYNMWNDFVLLFLLLLHSGSSQIVLHLFVMGLF